MAAAPKAKGVIRWTKFHSPAFALRKPRTRVVTSKTYARVEKLTGQLAPAVHVDLKRGLTTFKNRISAPALHKAWQTRNANNIMREIPWPDLRADLGEFKNGIHRSSFVAGRISVEALPPPIQPKLRFDMKNPLISDYVDTRVGNLVELITEDTRTFISNQVRRSFDEALTPDRIASQIKGRIGLTERYEVAVQNYQNGLLGGGMDPIEADSLVDAYADRLLDSRAMTIARSETRRAANEGQLSIWHQATMEGLIDKSMAKKVWIVDGNPCTICEPMDGEEAPLDGHWVLPDGSLVEVPSDSHPNCLCNMELTFSAEEPNDDGDDDESDIA